MTTRFRIKLAKEISQKWLKGVDTVPIKTQAVDQADHKCKIQPLKWTLRSGLGDLLPLGLGARWAAALHPDPRGGGGASAWRPRSHAPGAHAGSPDRAGVMGTVGTAEEDGRPRAPPDRSRTDRKSVV